jgi:hypothetical protein
VSNIHGDSSSKDNGLSYYSQRKRTQIILYRPKHTVAVEPLLCSGNKSTRNSRVELYVTTDGQPVSLSWNKAHIWRLRPDFYYFVTVTVLFLWGALSDERTGLTFIYAAGPCSAIFLWSEPLGSRDHILLSQIRDFPFRRLLRLARSRWRYSIPPPHGETVEILLETGCFLRGPCRGVTLKTTGVTVQCAVCRRVRIPPP